MPNKKRRLDEIVLDRGLADSRNQARALIMAGKIRSGTTILDKAGKTFPEEVELSREEDVRFVSRGAEKLQGFLREFPLPVEGKTVLDVGASTGGFTDYLLQAGAVSSVCVDVGYGQLHHKLREDERVINLERLNARHLKPGDLPGGPFDIIVMDLSFISLETILPGVWPFLAPSGHLIALVKPQFEVGKEVADRFQGVIRDSGIQEAMREKILHFAAGNLPGAKVVGYCRSPIAGTKGNREWLVGWRRARLDIAPDKADL